MLYFTGTSGLLLPYKNKSFYPEDLQDKSRLQVYSTLFNTLEVNSSFYKIPQAKTMAKWAREVQGDFRFTFKLWKGITHIKGFEYSAEEVTKFMEAIQAVGDKKGCLLVQLPPSLTFSAFSRLKNLLETIIANDKDREWKICVEFRHPSWYCAPTYQLLNSCQSIIVFHDKNNSGLNIEETDAPYIYLRFHGPDGNYRGSYETAVLEEYGHYIHDWLREGKEVYVYFNNTMGAAIANLQYLSRFVKSLR